MMGEGTEDFLYDLMEGKHDQVLARFNRRGDEIESITIHGHEGDTGADHEEGESVRVTLDFFEAHPDDNAAPRGTLLVVWVWRRGWHDGSPIGMEGDTVVCADTWYEEEVPEEERLTVEAIDDDRVLWQPASFKVHGGEVLAPIPRVNHPRHAPWLAPGYADSDSLPF